MRGGHNSRRLRRQYVGTRRWHVSAYYAPLTFLAIMITSHLTAVVLDSPSKKLQKQHALCYNALTFQNADAGRPRRASWSNLSRPAQIQGCGEQGESDETQNLEKPGAGLE